MRDLSGGRLAQKGAVRKYDDRQCRAVNSSCLENLLRVLLCFDIEPLVRYEITTEKIADFSRMRRPLMSDHAHALKCRVIGRLPIVEQVIDHAVEAFLRRVPRFHQVMVDVDVVDGANGRVRIGVSRQQRPLCFRV